MVDVAWLVKVKKYDRRLQVSAGHKNTTLFVGSRTKKWAF